MVTGKGAAKATGLFVVLALGLTACGSGGGASGTPEPKGTPSGDASVDLAQLEAAANAEGALTWYTTDPASDLPKIIAAFNESYPGIKVDALRLSADKIPARILTEQRGGKFNADVISGDSTFTAQLIPAGAVQPFNPPDAAPPPAGLELPEGYRTVQYVNTTVIAYNPKILKEKGLEVPRSWTDLAKPEWKGLFSMIPDEPGWYDSLITTMGADKAHELIVALGNNNPRIVESHTQAVTDVQSGEVVATGMAYGYKAASFKAKTPESVDFVNPDQVPTTTDLIVLAKKAPHPNAAKVFMNWVLSQKGQQSFVDITKQVSVREDVNNDTSVWDTSKWEPAWADPAMPEETFNKYLTELRAAFHTS